MTETSDGLLQYCPHVENGDDWWNKKPGPDYGCGLGDKDYGKTKEITVCELLFLKAYHDIKL